MTEKPLTSIYVTHRCTATLNGQEIDFEIEVSDAKGFHYETISIDKYAAENLIEFLTSNLNYLRD